MIIKSMSIKNYRPYKDPEPIKFANGEKNITIVEGRNDAGKTSFINAITWCLYDREPFREEGLEDRCNKLAIKEANINDKIDVKVEILMEDNAGNNVQIIREQKFTKTGNLTASKDSESFFSIFVEKDGNSTREINPEKYIETNLPNSLQEYFIFTGEKLTQFLNKENDFVKKGVHTLYQLDLLDNVHDQAKRWEQYYRGQFRTINPQLAQLKENLSVFEENQINDKNTLEENLKSIESFKLTIENLYAQISSSGGDVDEIRENIKKYEDEITSLNIDLNEEQENYSSLIFKNFSKIASYDLLKELEYWENFESTSEEDDEFIPFAVKDLKKLLKRNECVCGNEIKEGSESYNNIQNLINYLENNIDGDKINIEEEISNLLLLSRNIISRYPEDFSSELDNSTQKMAEIEANLNLKSVLINRLKLKLKQLDVDEIDEIHAKINYYEDMITNLKEANGVLKDNLETYPVLIRECKEEIEKAEGEESKRNEFNKKMEFCKDIKNISKQIYNELSVHIYEELGKKVTESYKTIHWKADYQRVIVDQDFNVSIEKTDGDIVSASDPSTGSRNVLALTFIAALNSLSGFTLPLVLDTPIASLDNQMRSDVAKYLPIYMEGKQMILLVMNSEYTGDFKLNIKPYVGEQYRLDYTGEEGNGKTVINKLED